MKTIGEVRRIEEGRTRAEASLDAERVQSGRRGSLTAAAPGQVAERVDAVAGSEFVDDRIRLRE